MEQKISTEEFHKEIDLIQACITRMADNSFRLKEWYITLIAIALTILLGQKCELFLIGFFLWGVTIIFWGLDAFFLKMETLYRWKYEWVIEKRPLGEKRYLYDLKPDNCKMWLNAENKSKCFMNFVVSKTLLPLYGVIWGIATFIMILAFVLSLFLS